MSKAGKRGKSAQGAAAGAKWEQGLLAAVFEEVYFLFYFSRLACLAQNALYSELNQKQRDDTTVDSIYLMKMQVCKR